MKIHHPSEIRIKKLKELNESYGGDKDKLYLEYINKYPNHQLTTVYNPYTFAPYKIDLAIPPHLR